MNTILNWSSGKDAALAYYLLEAEKQYTVSSLLTTVNAEKDRVVMHGVRKELLQLQAEHINIPLSIIELPPAPTNDVYAQTMKEALTAINDSGISHAAFGDIFLEDLKSYREEQLRSVGFNAVFPLWGRDTKELVELIEDVGIEAIIICAKAKGLGKGFLGRRVDRQLINDLPDGIDPCGENGEFHTFVYNAPYFSKPIDINKGEVVYTEYNNNPEHGFYFLDIAPNQ